MGKVALWAPGSWFAKEGQAGGAVTAGMFCAPAMVLGLWADPPVTGISLPASTSPCPLNMKAGWLLSCLEGVSTFWGQRGFHVISDLRSADPGSAAHPAKTSWVLLWPPPRPVLRLLLQNKPPKTKQLQTTALSISQTVPAQPFLQGQCRQHPGLPSSKGLTEAGLCFPDAASHLQQAPVPQCVAMELLVCPRELVAGFPRVSDPEGERGGSPDAFVRSQSPNPTCTPGSVWRVQLCLCRPGPNSLIPQPSARPWAAAPLWQKPLPSPASPSPLPLDPSLLGLCLSSVCLSSTPVCISRWSPFPLSQWRQACASLCPHFLGTHLFDPWPLLSASGFFP